jgi:hypothetical protein
MQRVFACNAKKIPQRDVRDWERVLSNEIRRQNRIPLSLYQIERDRPEFSGVLFYAVFNALHGFF